MSEVVTTVDTQSIWVKASFEFGATFSYRLPGASSQFAVGVPVPSPAAVKLAIVAAAIHSSGDVRWGERVFEEIRSATVWFGLPRRVARFRAFIKRLKSAEGDGAQGSKGREFTESTGARDYFLLEAPLEVFLQIRSETAEEVTELLKRVRRFGTSDSLCWCTDVEVTVPDIRHCAVPLEALGFQLEDTDRLLVSLLDLNPSASFRQVDPYSAEPRRGNPFVRVPYALPLRVEASGTNWTLFVRTV